MKNLYDTALTPELWVNTVQYSITAEDNTEAAGDPPATESPPVEGNAPAEAEGAQEGAEKSAGDDGKKPWFMERIDGLTRQKHQLENERQTLAQQNAALRQTVETLLAQGATPREAAQAAGEHAEALEDAGNAGAGRRQANAPQGRLYTEAELQQMAAQYAQQMAQKYAQDQSEQTFNARCNAVAAEGQKQFPDFRVALENLSAAGVLPNAQVPMQQQAAQRVFLETVTEFDEAPVLLHHLGRHPDEAIRIAHMRPAAMAAALSKLTAKLASPRNPSNAPPPVTTTRGTAAPPAPSLEDKSVSMEEWVRLREEQLAKRAGR